MKKTKFLATIALLVATATSSANASFFNHNKGLTDGLSKPYPAPEIIGTSDWLNSKPLKIAELKGKVVLIDFWTYSCINCLRTLPHITKWDEKYRDQGLVIIGIHAPEFEFEKNLDNVKKALTRYGIKYPVTLDNDMNTWSAFNNRYWPAHYLIDKNGNVVYTHFGEGNYDVTENNIRYLLKLEGDAIADDQKSTINFGQTSETYLGFERTENFYSKEKNILKETKFSFPNSLPLHGWALSGKWKIEQERIISAEKDAKLKLNFKSKKVFLVMGNPKSKAITVSLKLNGKELSQIIVDKHQLYELVNQDEFESGLLELSASDSGLEAYAFTFGR